MAETDFLVAVERGLAAHRAGQFEEAIAAYRSALTLAPQDNEILSLYGLALAHDGRLAEAEQPIMQAAEREPQSIEFRLNLAEYLTMSQQLERALREVDFVLSRDSRLVRAWVKRGDLLILLGQTMPSAEAYESVLALDPANFAAAIKLAKVRIVAGQHDLADQALSHANRIAPNQHVVFELHSHILSQARNWTDLESVGRVWSEAHPSSAAAWRVVARAALELGRPRRAIEAFAKVIDFGPRTAELLTAYGRLCLQGLEIDAAGRALDEAEQLDPERDDMLAAKALLLLFRGDLDEAETYCRRALARNPQNAPAYTVLVQIKRGQLSESEMSNLEGLIKAEQEPVENRIMAAFALGDALDAHSKTDEAFATYQLAQAMNLERDRVEGRAYSRERATARTDKLVSLFSTRVEDTPKEDRPTPIFIVGMPRSGTTLVEAALGAHSRIVNFGERTRMYQTLEACLALNAMGRELDEDTLRQWRDAYFIDVPDIRPASHITDKLPFNFESAGLIARLFPNTIIINIRRNPIETGLSIFRHEFNKHWPFAHRLEDIGHFYGQYARLVAHWERALAPRFVTIQYEDLVADFERGVRGLVAACGLSWEPACLAFQETRRTIATFSAVQVREPIVARKRAGQYSSHLAPLIAALREAGVNLETGSL